LESGVPVATSTATATSSEVSGGGGGLTTLEPVAVAVAVSEEYSLPEFNFDGSKESIADAVGISDFYQFLIYVFGIDAIVSSIKEDLNTYFKKLTQEEKKLMLHYLLISFFPDTEVLEIQDDTPAGCYDTISALIDATNMFKARGQKLGADVIKNDALAQNKFDIEFSRCEIIQAFVTENFTNIFAAEEEDDSDEDEDEDEEKSSYYHDSRDCICCAGFKYLCACVKTKGFNDCMSCPHNDN
jgi:hypothetical protein